MTTERDNVLHQRRTEDEFQNSEGEGKGKGLLQIRGKVRRDGCERVKRRKPRVNNDFLTFRKMIATLKVRGSNSEEFRFCLVRLRI